MNKIELTEEQKKCVEYPLERQTLIIDADPGTGKTEILRHNRLVDLVHRKQFLSQVSEKFNILHRLNYLHWNHNQFRHQVEGFFRHWIFI